MMKTKNAVVILFAALAVCFFVQGCKSNDTVTYEGKTYHTVVVGTQTWLQENLNVGVMIDSTKDQTDNKVIEKYCYNNNPANCEKYGGLYQWDEMMAYTKANGAKGICPDGFHVPTKAELETLLAAAGGNANALKAVGEGSKEGVGTNTTNFSALLSGLREDPGIFGGKGILLQLRSSTEGNTESKHFRSDRPDNNSAWSLYIPDIFGSASFYDDPKFSGYSVRCIKDK